MTYLMKKTCCTVLLLAALFTLQAETGLAAIGGAEQAPSITTKQAELEDVNKGQPEQNSIILPPFKEPDLLGQGAKQNMQAEKNQALEEAERQLQALVDTLRSQTENFNQQREQVNRALDKVADNQLPQQSSVTATVAGNLNHSSAGQIGTFGFKVDLNSGNINNGQMNGSDVGNHWGGGSFALSGGTGSLRGNNFDVGFIGLVSGNSWGFNGRAAGSLQGTAANGFGSVGDAITGGSFAVTQPNATPITSGSIDGARVQ